jgi:hypothetical protein
MNVNIALVTGLQEGPAAGPAEALTPVYSGTSAPRGQGIHVDRIPFSPPPEVLAAITIAAESYQALLAGGRELSFGIDPRTRRVIVEVRDAQGNLLGTAPPSTALDIAAGATLD